MNNTSLIRNIHEMVQLKARECPDKVALRFRKGRNNVEAKTYKEVFEDVKKVAQAIDEKYGRGKNIAIIGENSYEWLLAFFGILASGNVAVPIDKALPENEIHWLLNKADVVAAIVSGTYEDLVVNAEGVESLTFKKLTKLEPEGSNDFSFADTDSKELACIIFTSGTTGHSKGVMLSHESIIYDFTYALEVVDPPELNILVVLPFHHAFGLVASVLAPYYKGYELFINKSLKNVKEDLLLSKPKLMLVVPMFVEEFYRQIQESVKKSGKEGKLKFGLALSRVLLIFGIDIRKKLFKEVLEAFGGRLETIICGGARLDALYQSSFKDYGIDIINGYGASECAPIISVQSVKNTRYGSVGTPLTGVEVKISSENEVLVKGPIVMQGYYKDEAETAKALHEGWYKTGDIGYVDENNYLFLTGRLKNLIILSNGENISPEELEGDMEKDDAVRAVLVYEKKGQIVAEIYPAEDYLKNQEYFDNLIAKVNEGRPIYKQIGKVILREEDFIRNTSQKIVRFKNIKED